MPAKTYENWGASVPHGVEAHFYADCSSTNDIAASYGCSKAVRPTWIIAGTQSGGRGRKGRPWVSEEGNLYASLIFCPSIRPLDIYALPYLVALAVRDAVIQLGAPPDDVQCKWPNDILLKGQKVCGILIESSARSSSALEYVIIGVGLNLRHSPENAQFKATSLKDALAKDISVKDAIQTLANTLKQRLQAWDTQDFTPIKNEWTGCAWGLGEKRLINTDTAAFLATLLGLDDFGSLAVRLESGEERFITTADIFPTISRDGTDGTDGTDGAARTYGYKEV